MRTFVLSTALCFGGVAFGAPTLHAVSAPDGTLVIDTSGDPALVKAAHELYRRAKPQGTKDIGPVVVPPADYPPALRKLSDWRLITTEGPKPFAVKKVEAVQGCADFSLTITTDLAGTGEALAVTEAVPAKTKLRAIEGKPVAASTALVESLVRGMPALNQSWLGKLRPPSEAVREIRGNFSNGATKFVWIGTELQPPNADQVTFTYAAFTDDRGKVLGALIPAASGMGDGTQSLEPQWLVDLDGDGTDEVVVKRSYYENGSSVIFRSEGKGWKEVAFASWGC